jgi:hypothetical protein
MDDNVETVAERLISSESRGSCCVLDASDSFLLELEIVETVS